ncbi:hypothetical protein DM02DRAFT_623992 [Periconia macrospinosa]|uniref:Uncharacterized protein n=1 Tax=Periconia macrospinosa TaxID=97972 RepID=A0A2V1E8N4_9PLEO|nr:hypothetical protein DM02DRAFT_623992 [Periconia macrospinosa]
MNATVRPTRPGSRTIFLDDTAQHSSAVPGIPYGSNVLRPSEPGHPCMPFSLEGSSVEVHKWIPDDQIAYEKGSGEYLHSAMHGHPRMSGLLLEFTKEMLKRDQPSQALTQNRWHLVIVQHETGFVEHLKNTGRGLWTAWAKSHTADELERYYSSESPMYAFPTLRNIQDALREATQYPGDVTHDPHKCLDAFGFCYKIGYLHTRKCHVAKKEIMFTLAYRRLHPGVESDALLPEGLTL